MIEQLEENDETLFKDCDDQIAHWKATLADIVTVIDERVCGEGRGKLRIGQPGVGKRTRVALIAAGLDQD